MIKSQRRRVQAVAILLLGVVASPVATLVAQDGGVTLDFGGVTTQDVGREAIPDSILSRALAIFNAPATSRYFGGSQIRATLAGDVGVYDANILISGHIQGNVVVVNGDLRLQSGGQIDGEIIVLGGRFSPDSGAVFRQAALEYRSGAVVRLTSSSTLVRTTAGPSLRELTSRAAVRIGDFLLTPRVGVGVYNRVEGLPIRVGPSFTWTDSRISVEAAGDLIVRTARDPGGNRGAIGWWATLLAHRGGDSPMTIGVESGNQVTSTADRVLSSLESSLNSVLFRRDYRDWIGEKGTSVFATWQPLPAVDLGIKASRVTHRSLATASPFSLLREGDPWRANPLVDDGTFTVVQANAGWTNTSDRSRLDQGWDLRLGVRRTTSSDITPVLLTEQIRDPLSQDSYGSWEASFDLRRLQRIDPRNAVYLRLSGQGWIGGDPLTVQRRVALNGAAPFPGYAFRSIACDSRRRADPAAPALCDRRMMLQAEYRRTIDVGLGTKLGPYGIGIEQADLLLFTDFGSAWLSGDGPGQVPSNRIQSFGEWSGDLGIGVDAGWLGAYLARSITEEGPVRLSFRLQRRF